jgi:hypothetical protein
VCLARLLGVSLARGGSAATVRGSAEGSAVYHDDVADYVTNAPTITANALGIALMAWFAAGP